MIFLMLYFSVCLIEKRVVLYHFFEGSNQAICYINKHSIENPISMVLKIIDF